MDNDDEHKKAKGTKNCVIKRRIMVNNYKDCLFNYKIILNRNKDSKVITKMYILNKSIRLHQVVMMIKECRDLIKLQRIHTEQTHSKYAKVRC